MQGTQTDRPKTPLTDDGTSRLLIGTAWTIWDNAMLLIACSVLLVVVLTPFLIVASATGWLLAWAPMTLAAAPIWRAAIAISDRLLDGRGVRVGELPQIIRSNWRVAVQLALVPAVLGSLALGLLESIDGAEGTSLARLMIPGAVGALLAVAVLIGPAFAMAASTGAGARVAWLLAARQVASRPIQQIGLVACFGLLLWFTVLIGPVALLGLGPFAMLTAALARTSTYGAATGDNSTGKQRP